MQKHFKGIYLLFYRFIPAATTTRGYCSHGKFIGTKIILIHEHRQAEPRRSATLLSFIWFMFLFSFPYMQCVLFKPEEPRIINKLVLIPIICSLHFAHIIVFIILKDYMLKGIKLIKPLLIYRKYLKV